MNYTNKDFYARIGNIEELSFPARSAQRSTEKEDCITNSKTHAISQATIDFRSITGRLSSISNPTRKTTNCQDRAGSAAIQSKSNTSTSYSAECSYVVVAITEGRGHAEGEIGIAAMDVNSPLLILSQISDAFWYREILQKLEILNPAEIIVSLTVYNAGSKLLDEIRIFFHNTTITPIPRRHFSDESIMNLLNSLCMQSCKSVLSVIEKKYYALSATTGLFAYLKNMLMMSFVPNSLKIVYQIKYSRMFIGKLNHLGYSLTEWLTEAKYHLIRMKVGNEYLYKLSSNADYECYHRLELLYSLVVTKEKRCCLFGFLNSTVTAAGSRCLRAYILEPFCEAQNIYEMQNCIKELLADRNFLYNTHDCLKKFSCCDRLLKLNVLPPEGDKAKFIEIMLNRVLLLKTTLEILPELRSILKNSKSTIFMKLLNALQDTRFDAMLTEIKKSIQPEVTSIKATTQCFQRIYAIKSGICEYLDLMRIIYSNLIDVMKNTVNDLAEKFGLALRLKYSASRGFHMQLTPTKKNAVINIPAELDILDHKGNNYYLTSVEFSKLNMRIGDVIDELHIASFKVTNQLVQDLLQYADALYELIGAISSLDMILSLAKVSSKDGFCCPKFGQETKIIDATYPFLEYTSLKPVPVANNIIGTPEYNFYVITGPNMGGKTLYIKTIGVLQIMAQLGCYVPAHEATFRLCDRIFTRIGYEDRVEKNSSSYVKEINEFEYIFANITPNSLVLIDEICRNTNPEEGKQIAFKISLGLAAIQGKKEFNHQQIENIKTESQLKNQDVLLWQVAAPFIYLTTHFFELTKLINDHPNISNLFLHAEKRIIDDKLHLTYTHKVMNGVTPIRGYGLALARTVRFPREILQRADEMYENLLVAEKNKHQSQADTQRKHFNHHSIIANLEESIRNATQTRTNISPPKMVASFLNKSTFRESQIDADCSKSANSSGLLELSSAFYDVYSQVASTLRESLSDYSQKCSEILESFCQKQPQELLQAINQMNGTQLEMEITRPIREVTNNKSDALPNSQTTSTAERTNLMDLSYHSLARRLGCDDDSKFADSPTRLCTPNCRYTPSANSHSNSIGNITFSSSLCENPCLSANVTCPSRLENVGFQSVAGNAIDNFTFPLARNMFLSSNSDIDMHNSE